MLVAAVFLPSAPVLVPRVAAGAAAELTEVRDTGRSALQAMIALAPDLVVVLAAGPGALWPDTPSSFARVGLSDPPADARPLALQVGRWFVEQVEWAGPTQWRSVDGSSGDFAAGPQRIALVALGDGSARRSVAAPGHIHADAEAYDDAVACSLAQADSAGLLALSPADDQRLLVSGRPVWQSAARAAQEAGGGWTGQLRWSGAPLGVGYFVATWRR